MSDDITKRMTLQELIHGVDVVEVKGPKDIAIQGVAYHSRSVQKGYLFVAVHGEESDGHLFLDEAVRQGASAVVVSQPLRLRPDLSAVSQVVVRDSRDSLARISAAFYGDPSRELTVVGITGTNGKTTCSYLIESLLQAEGKSTAVIGTITYRYEGKSVFAPMTTPESLDIQRMMSEMVRARVTHLILEVSSHALSMKRADGCHFDGALFTNLGRDHLDYHRTLEAYAQSKRRLFDVLLPVSAKKEKFQVINQDDSIGRTIPDHEGVTTYRYGLTETPQGIGVQWMEMDESGIKAELSTPVGSLSVKSPLLGRHNLSNILGAIGVGCALGLSRDALREGIRRLEGVPGRLEKIRAGKPSKERGAVFVDYAHTPDALENVLSTLHPLVKGRMITLFGCGGDRDRGKRSEMGQASLRYSNLVILTSDNPRTEDPFGILEDIEKGMKGAQKIEKQKLWSWDTVKGPVYTVIPDRREAIRTAVEVSQAGDIVLLAGKGHEDYQILGRKRVYFDDREEARKALNPPLRGDL